MEDGADVEDEGVVDVESCGRCVADGVELDAFGEDCANADVAIARAAEVARNRRLFIWNLLMCMLINPWCAARFRTGKFRQMRFAAVAKWRAAG